MKLTVLLLAVAACSYGLAHDIMRLDVLQQASDTESTLLLPEDEAELSVLEQRRDELMALVEEMETEGAPEIPQSEKGPMDDGPGGAPEMTKSQKGPSDRDPAQSDKDDGPGGAPEMTKSQNGPGSGDPTAPADEQKNQTSAEKPEDKAAKDRTGLRIAAEAAVGDKAAAITAEMDEPAKLEQQAKQAKTAKDAVKADIKSAQANAEDTQGADKEAIKKLIEENVELRAKLAALQKSVQDDDKKVKKAEEEKQAESLYTMGLDELRNLNSNLKKQIGIDGHTIKRINSSTLAKMSKDDLAKLDEDLKGVMVSSKVAEAEDKADKAEDKAAKAKASTKSDEETSKSGSSKKDP